MKRILILTLIFAVVALTLLMASTMRVSAATYSGSCGENVTYNLNTSTGLLTISGTGSMNNYSTQSYNGTNATTAPWGQYYSSIKYVTINSGVTSIGNYAFYGCTGLTSITIPDSVTSIGWHAFGNTTWYNNQPNGLVYAGKVAYKYKGTCPSNVTIKGGTLGIAGIAFYNCTGLTSITIPDSVTNIGGNAFQNCTGLTRITIPSSVTSIGSSAFSGCTGLTSITIPDSVTSIGSYAFYGCTGLTSITIPDSVTSIGSQAFYNTTWYNNQPNGLVYAGKVAYIYKGTCPSSVTIKGGTQGIAGGAFYGCTGLTSITIPDSVTSIGNSAFYGCTGLTIITIPDSVTSIGGNAFSNCPNLSIVGVQGSIAETYAKENDIPFISIDAPVISASDLKLAPGEEAELTFKISGNTGISVLFAGVGLPEGVTLIEAENGDVFDVAEIEQNIVLESGGVQSVKDGDVVTLKIKTANSIAPGNYAVRLIVYECYSGDESVVDIIAVPTFITVKTRQTAPSAPTVLKSAPSSVTLTEISGTEYSIDGENWQTSNVFEGLDPFESYTFYCRIAETESTFASEASEGTSVGTRALYGDANGDGKVSALDIVRLKRYLASVDENGLSEVVIHREADVNVDNKYDSLDVARLRRYFANYNMKTGKSTVVLGKAE